MDEFIGRVRANTETFFSSNGRRPCFFIKTYGCQMNARESEQMAGMLLLMGFEVADCEDGCDLILYNTCCVRENAENKILGNLGRAKYIKDSKPDLIVAFCGCMAAQDSVPETLEANYPYVDIIFGTNERYNLPRLLCKFFEARARVIEIESKSVTCRETENDLKILATRNQKHKTGVNIMYGCDNFCSYCIVPYVRGRERSREPGDVINEMRILADDGVKEIMLLGQNVNAYGKNLYPKTNFAELLRRANEIPGLSRIRFLTSHPKDFSDDLISAAAECEKVCKAVHLPLQSGSSRVLQKMNRGYTREDYLGLVLRLKDAIPGVGISTDIIVGFPGETEEDFFDTLEVVRRADFSGAFTFLYSKRSGTPAAKAEDAVPEEIMNERFKRLLDTLNPMLAARNEKIVGEILPVMSDESRSNKNGTRKGRADDNTLVHFKGEAEPGEIVRVKITEAKTFYLTGEKI